MVNSRAVAYWFYEPEEYERYMDHLTLKAEKNLSEALKTVGAALSWDQLIACIKGSEALQKLVAGVIADAFQEITQKGELVFASSALRANEGDNVLQFHVPHTPMHQLALNSTFCPVFSPDDRADILMDYISYVEKLHHKRLSGARAAGYSLPDYIGEVQADDILYDELIYAFDDGIRRIGAAISWTGEQVEIARALCETYEYAKETGNEES